MSWPRDPELDEIFPTPEHRSRLELLSENPPHRIEPDLMYRATLRRRLMQEAWAMAEPGLPWWRRLLAPPGLAWAGATIGVLLIAFLAYTLTVSPTTSGKTVAWNSPLQDAHAVATVQPIVLTFKEPVDHHSVEAAVRIEPATTVTYEWQGNDLKVTPVNRLAPGTQYQVSLAPSARTESGQPVPVRPAVVFVTQPAPPATPVPTPTPAAGVTAEQVLGSVGAAPAAWSRDGSTLYLITPDGALEAYTVATGKTAVVASGVTRVAVGPDGTPAYASGGEVSYGQQKLTADRPLALGFRNGRLLVLAGRSVLTVAEQPAAQPPAPETSASPTATSSPATPSPSASSSATTPSPTPAAPTQLASLSQDPSAGDFSPNGDRLAYLMSGGLHVLELSTGKDSVIGSATGLGDWSPDSSRYAYLDVDGAHISDGHAAVLLTAATGLSGLSWSGGDDLLLAGSSGISLVHADGSELRLLAAGAYGQPDWAPGAGVFAFHRAGQLFTARVPSARPAPASTQEDVLDAFLQARGAGNAEGANGYLDDAGKQAFAGLKLVYKGNDGQLVSYNVLFSQPGRAVVRLVIAQGQDRRVVMETLTFARQGSAKTMVHGVTETAAPPLGSGPNVLSVTATGHLLRVTFDADLDPATIAGVSLSGVRGQNSYDASSRTVVIDTGAALVPGNTYTLGVTADVKDVNHAPATPFKLDLLGPPLT
ncbi:MAG: Ig-like domain-containing protein [Candidatus Dormibacteraeota bacterium]|nr:Ig-like domain-containing protein [Candidatus Dormibacteraeota bacterium]